jgi:hypothetical protein
MPVEAGQKLALTHEDRCYIFEVNYFFQIIFDEISIDFFWCI